MWALCIKVIPVNKIKDGLLSTELAIWRKKGLFIIVILLSLSPFIITYLASQADLENNLWQLRHFIAIAVIQAIAQISIAWYILKNKVPNYLILSFSLMMFFFQLTFDITVILIANA